MTYAVFNPLNKLESELPVIFGFNNGGSNQWYDAVLLAEDGTYLGGHICSNECFMYGDLGIIEGTRPDRHETFRKHYPDGYRMDFVRFADVRNHKELTAAIEKHKAEEERLSLLGELPEVVS